jgi:hypothetical protein
MNRKDQLTKRATQFGNRYAENGLTAVWRAQDGYVAGYKAAMREVRREVANTRKFIHQHPLDRLSDFYLRIYKLARPLR